MIRPEALQRLSNPAEWATTPYKHIVLEDFLEPDIFKAVAAEARALREADATARHMNKLSTNEFNKLGFGDLAALGPTTQAVFRQLHSAKFTGLVERGVGIGNIVSDAALRGAGIHCIKPGGFLNVHTDFNMYRTAEGALLDRRLNILIYLNEDWQEAWGGHLELWDGATETRAARHLPIANRCVVFATTRTSWHGHPVPLTCPADRQRLSLASYYYTENEGSGVDFEGDARHSTRFVRWGSPA